MSEYFERVVQTVCARCVLIGSFLLPQRDVALDIRTRVWLTWSCFCLFSSLLLRSGASKDFLPLLHSLRRTESTVLSFASLGGVTLFWCVSLKPKGCKTLKLPWSSCLGLRTRTLRFYSVLLCLSVPVRSCLPGPCGIYPVQIHTHACACTFVLVWQCEYVCKNMCTFITRFRNCNFFLDLKCFFGFVCKFLFFWFRAEMLNFSDYSVVNQTDGCQRIHFLYLRKHTHVSCNERKVVKRSF